MAIPQGPPGVTGRTEKAPSRLGRYLRGHWLTWVAYAISIGGLAYVVWNLDLPQLVADLARTTWWLVVVAALLDVVPRLLEAARWKYLLRPLPVSYRFVLQAVYVGTAYSGILPFSSGEFVRGVMVSSRARTSVASVFSTQLIERVSDVMALILLVWISIGGLALPRSLQIGIAGLETLVVLALVAGFIIYLRRRGLRARVDASQPSGRAGRWFKSVVLNMRASAVRVTPRGLLVAILAAIGLVGAPYCLPHPPLLPAGSRPLCHHNRRRSLAQWPRQSRFLAVLLRSRTVATRSGRVRGCGLQPGRVRRLDFAPDAHRPRRVGRLPFLLV
jgi:hypothetical protein